MRIRQPIVSVLGHVDHGKTTILDRIRGTSVAAKEAGGITQHIGATEVPIDAIFRICGPLIKNPEKFKIPGLLFIDTPGHHSFTTLRARGGALADLAVLVVDVNEGIMPQTVESINILKRYRTPFVIAANKIDVIDGWNRDTRDMPFLMAIREQEDDYLVKLEEKIYAIVEQLYSHGFSADRYDRISDFTRTLAIVPTSAKCGVGIADLLLVLIGLAQKFLQENLRTEEGPGEGTILEVKEERGLGKTLDVILYSGTIRKGDTIVVGGISGPIVTKVKALLRPKPLDEMRDPRDRFKNVEEVSAAAGVKISGPDLDGALAGAPVIVIWDDGEIERAKERVRKEMTINIETAEEGIMIKADALGSLEALAYELKNAKIPIWRAAIGHISRRDIVDAETMPNPFYRVILGFNVRLTADAAEYLENSDVVVFVENVIYKLVEEYTEWLERKREEMEREKRLAMNFPGKFKVLEDYIFRTAKPAIVGIRVIGGRVRVGQRILRPDGRVVGIIKSIRDGDKNLREAIAGQEVAVAMDGVTVGRQIKPGEEYYVNMNETDYKALKDHDLNFDEREIMEEIARIKRKERPFWGL